MQIQATLLSLDKQLAIMTAKDTASTRRDEEGFPDTMEQQADRLGCETDLGALPHGYYRSRFFIGSMMATGLGAWAAVASFVRPSAPRQTIRLMVPGIRRPHLGSNQCRPGP